MSVRASRLRVSTVLFLAASLMLLLIPRSDPVQAQTSDCGNYTGNVCAKVEVCVNIIFFEVCDTSYRWYEGKGSV
jgi:hypothetical protein